MGKIRKTYNAKVLETRKDGGRILISTPSFDRDKDRVMPDGADIRSYEKNPVVQWGHDYSSPWATVGKTTGIEVTPEGIVASFDLRPAANESDPQNIVRLLWEGGWVRTASIGFIPTESEPNEKGGNDFKKWELLEWSLVPIPANQDALALAVKAFKAEGDAPADSPSGAPASDAPRAKGPECRQADETEDECIARKVAEILEESPDMEREQAVAIASEMCAEMCEDEGDEAPAEDAPPPPPEPEQEGSKRAWIRRMEVESVVGKQVVFSCGHSYSYAVPKDATDLQINEYGECVEVPHPKAGQSVRVVDLNFCPPIELADNDAAFGCSGSDISENDLISMWSDDFTVIAMSDVVAEIVVTKSLKKTLGGIGISKLTRKLVDRGKLLQRKATRAERINQKRGRVLSAANETELRDGVAEIEGGTKRIKAVLQKVEPETESANDVVLVSLASMLGEAVKRMKR